MDTFESEESANEQMPHIIDQETDIPFQKIDTKERITSTRMTKFEKAHILGVRALQLSMSAPPLVDIEDETDPLKIAFKELKEGKIPFIIRRKLPDNSYEEWNVNELIVPYD